MKAPKIVVGRFFDPWRGNGMHISLGKWTLAVRRCWSLRLVHPPGKPGYTRLYFGPLEVERRT